MPVLNPCDCVSIQLQLLLNNNNKKDHLKRKNLYLRDCNRLLQN